MFISVRPPLVISILAEPTWFAEDALTIHIPMGSQSAEKAPNESKTFFLHIIYTLYKIDKLKDELLRSHNLITSPHDVIINMFVDSKEGGNE